MPKYITELTLDISGKRNNQTITAKQGDNKSRLIRITLVDGETNVVLEDGENVDFRCLKPDKKSCKLPTTIEEGGRILVELDDNALAVAGCVRADVEINNADGLVLSSTTFYIQVEPAANNGVNIPSTSNQKMARNLDMNGYGIQNLPTPIDDSDAVNKGYVDEQIKAVKIPVDSALDETSTNAIQNAVVAKEVQALKKYVDNAPQKTRYIFPVAELKNISVNGQSLLKKEIVKRTVTSKAGVSVNIPVITMRFYLYVGEVDFQTEEITPYFDLPVNYVANPTGLDASSISNIEDFSPYLKNSLYLDKFYPLDYLATSMRNYCTNIELHFGSNSFKFETSKMVGFLIRLDNEFANETIRDVAYEEFSTIFNSMTHLCLEYEKPKIQTIECAYIGG